jgi:Ca2+-binding RTX toxin-like protein
MNAAFANRVVLLLVLVGVTSVITVARADEQSHTAFASPEAAVAALIGALEANDTVALGALLGPDSEGILSSGDEVADANARAQFLADYQEKHALVAEEDGSMTLNVGENDWPLPIPLVAVDGNWYLDGAAGAQELIYRRIGRNELGAIAVCRGFIDAQIEYAAVGHDGDDAGIFAAKLRSDPGLHNGLYWPTTQSEPPSPAGEAVARAMAEGYRAVTGKRKPYHGYYYRMLFAQGANAEGGAMEYFVDGALTQGVALVAWPADYDVSGVMTFMVDLEGVVYQKDLGEATSSLVDDIQVFDPDSSWTIVESQVDF